MIKSFKKFNESAIFFAESDEFKNVLNKHKTPKDLIHDYLMDITDSNEIEVGNPTTYLKRINENSFNVLMIIRLKKIYKNFSYDLDKYLNLIEEQSEDIKVIKKYCNLICEQEGYNVKYENISIPFLGSVNNTKDVGYLYLDVKFIKIINSSDLDIAYKKYLKSDNEYKNAYQLVVKKMVESGIPENNVENLIDIHPEYDEMDMIIFGFLTNDEIIEIAEYNKNTKKLLFEENGIKRSVRDYKNGDCDQYII